MALREKRLVGTLLSSKVKETLYEMTSVGIILYHEVLMRIKIHGKRLQSVINNYLKSVLLIL